MDKLIRRCEEGKCINFKCKHHRNNIKQGMMYKAPCKGTDAIFPVEKKCTKCKTVKTISAFSFRVYTDRFDSVCKECRSEETRLRNEINYVPPRREPKIDNEIYQWVMKVMPVGSCAHEVN